MEILAIRKLQKRKVKQGNKNYEAYLLHIPKEWIDSLGLHKGDDIIIYLGDNNELILKPKKVIS